MIQTTYNLYTMECHTYIDNLIPTFYQGKRAFQKESHVRKHVAIVVLILLI